MLKSAYVRVQCRILPPLWDPVLSVCFWFIFGWDVTNSHFYLEAFERFCSRHLLWIWSIYFGGSAPRLQLGTPSCQVRVRARTRSEGAGEFEQLITRGKKDCSRVWKRAFYHAEQRLRWSQGQLSVMVNHVSASSCLQAANIFLTSKETRSSLERIPRKRHGMHAMNMNGKFPSRSQKWELFFSQLVWNLALLCVLEWLDFFVWSYAIQSAPVTLNYDVTNSRTSKWELSLWILGLFF